MSFVLSLTALPTPCTQLGSTGEQWVVRTEARSPGLSSPEPRRPHGVGARQNGCLSPPSLDGPDTAWKATEAPEVTAPESRGCRPQELRPKAGCLLPPGVHVWHCSQEPAPEPAYLPAHWRLGRRDQVDPSTALGPPFVSHLVGNSGKGLALWAPQVASILNGRLARRGRSGLCRGGKPRFQKVPHRP